MLSLLAASLIAAATVSPAPQEASSQATRPEVTMEVRLADLCEKLDRRREELRIPGMALAVVKDDHVILARGFGLCDVEKKLPATEQTLFGIGSTTKAFTAMLIGMLADEGKMSFDDPVRKHLPFFHLKDPLADAQVTVRDLLCHRTGITRCGTLSMANRVSREDVVRQLAEAEAWAPFRTLFLYNNEMYLSAGECVARAAGSSWETLVQQRIFAPLGMTSSNLSIDDMHRDARASKGYRWDSDEQRFRRLPMRPLPVIAAAGAINSNVLDMAKWVRFQLGRGVFEGKRLVSEERLAEMWKSQITMGGGADYGLGWMLHQRDGHRIVEHGGNIDGYAAEVCLFPDDHVGFVLLTNVTVTPLQSESQRMVYDALLGEWSEAAKAEAQKRTPGKPLEPSELDRYTGPYRLTTPPLEMNVSVQDNLLALEIVGKGTFKLNWPDQRGRWSFQQADDLAVAFRRLENGYVPALTFYQSGVEIPMPRAKESTSAPIAINVDELMEKREQAHGAEHAAELGTIKLTGTVRFVHQGLSGQVTWLFADTDRFVKSLDFGRFGAIRMGLDGTTAWESSMMDLTSDDEPKGSSSEAAILLHPALIFGDWRDLFESLSITGTEKVNGEEAYVVRCVRKRGAPVKKFVSTKTFLLVAEDEPSADTGLAAMPARIMYGDYRDVHGLKLPFRSWRESPDAGRLVVQFEKAETNVSVPEHAFARGASD